MSLLNVHDEEFASLSPHFTEAGLQYLREEIGWENILPGYAHYPASFKRVVPFLFANLVFHYTFLRNGLAATHPLWNAHIFRSQYDVFMSTRQFVVSGVSYNKDTKMTATGIPGHLSITASLNRVTKELADLRLELEQRSVTRHAEVVDLFRQQPTVLRQCMLDNFTVNGAVPVTQDSINTAVDRLATTLSNQMEQLRSDLSTSQPTGGHGVASAAGRDPSTPFETQQFPRGAVKHYWGGKFRYVCRSDCSGGCHNEQYLPYNFVFPHCSCQELWQLWHFGHDMLNIGPYRLMSSDAVYRSDVVYSTENVTTQRIQSQMLSKAANVMKAVEAIALDQHNRQQQGRQTYTPFVINKTNSLLIFLRAYDELVGKLYVKSPGRPEDVAFVTILNKIGKHNKNPTVEVNNAN